MREFPGAQWMVLEGEKDVLLFDKLDRVKNLFIQNGIPLEEEFWSEELADILAETIAAASEIGERMEKIRCKT